MPKERIQDRDAYEFLAARGVSGGAHWTRDIHARGAALSLPGRCYRVNVFYNAGLKRYLLVMPVPTTRSRDDSGRIDTRARGGLAVYDAPEPWGPWTTAFFSEPWDVGPGDSAGFPTQWMSADGRTLHLVFSGNDAFCVRQAFLK